MHAEALVVRSEKIKESVEVLRSQVAAIFTLDTEPKFATEFRITKESQRREKIPPAGRDSKRLQARTVSRSKLQLPLYVRKDECLGLNEFVSCHALFSTVETNHDFTF